MKFGFQEDAGCTEASFTVLETIYHMLEHSRKIFSCFLYCCKTFNTVSTDGLLYNLLSEFGIRGMMWLVARDLYTNFKAQVFYEGPLFRKIDVSQGTGQGGILALFMHNMSFIGLLNVLSNHCYAILINGSCASSPSLTDDISVLLFHPCILSQNIHEYLQLLQYQLEV